MVPRPWFALDGTRHCIVSTGRLSVMFFMLFNWLMLFTFLCFFFFFFKALYGDKICGYGSKIARYQFSLIIWLYCIFFQLHINTFVWLQRLHRRSTDCGWNCKKSVFYIFFFVREKDQREKSITWRFWESM